MEFTLNQYHGNITNDELLDDVKRIYNHLSQETLTYTEYRKAGGKYGKTTFRRHLGSWITVLELCHIRVKAQQLATSKTVHEYRNISTEDLLNDICQIAEHLGKEAITIAEYNEYGKFSVSTYHKRFSSWNNALVKAGLQPYLQVAGQRRNDEDLLKEIETVWIKLGRQPTTTDIKNGVSKYSLNTYSRHFGGWRGALNAFIEYINSDTEDIVEPFDISEHVIVNDKYLTTATTSKTISRDINLRLRFKVMQRDNFKCVICGASPATNPTVILHIDHIVPWAKGGQTKMENLQTLCSNCNLGKSDLDM